MINHAIFTGRIGKKIEIRKTKEGKSVCNFQLGCSRNQDITDWIPCVAWEKTADWLSVLPVGTLVIVSGSIQTRQWEAEGKKNYATEVLVGRFETTTKGATRPTTEAPQEDEEEFESLEDRLNRLENEAKFDTGPILDIDSSDLPF